MNCFVIDIDGTVADASHRIHFIQKKPKDWQSFFNAASADTPIEHMRAVVHCLWFAGYVVFMSGRPERLRQVTQDWLRVHKFHISIPDVKLYMRADGDFRDDSIVKFELLQKLRSDGYHPIMAFDDRNRVVKMWRDNGIPCAQVAPGDF